MSDHTSRREPSGELPTLLQTCLECLKHLNNTERKKVCERSNRPSKEAMETLKVVNVVMIKADRPFLQRMMQAVITNESWRGCSRFCIPSSLPDKWQKYAHSSCDWQLFHHPELFLNKIVFTF